MKTQNISWINNTQHQMTSELVGSTVLNFGDTNNSSDNSNTLPDNEGDPITDYDDIEVGGVALGGTAFCDDLEPLESYLKKLSKKIENINDVAVLQKMADQTLAGIEQKRTAQIYATCIDEIEQRDRDSISLIQKRIRLLQLKSWFPYIGTFLIIVLLSYLAFFKK